MSHPTQPKASKPVPLTVRNTVMICDYINRLNMSPKEFMVTFLSSTHEDIIYRQRLSKGRDIWENLILEEASKIVNAQDMPRGSFPAGPFVSSNAITPDFFSDSYEKLRNNQVKSGMKFLHTLVYRKVAHSIKKKVSTHMEDDDSYEVDPVLSQSMSQGSVPGKTQIEDALDEATIRPIRPIPIPISISISSPPPQSDLFLSFAPTTSTSYLIPSFQVPTSVCAMIAFTCNRRCNAIPVANGLMTLASGVSCRVHEWLHALGLTTSRPSVLQALEHFRVLQESRIMDLFKINHKLMPFLCYDNVDINLKIHNTRVEKNSRLFHGTWGFFNVIHPSLLTGVPQEALGLSAFRDAMATAARKPVCLSLFAPGPEESKHWRLTVKAQLAKSLKDYIEHLPGGRDVKRVVPLPLKPPPIDPLEWRPSNIHFLRMMDAPDSSAEGVSRVLDQIMSQIGMDSDTYSKYLLIAGGDVGSNQLVESLRGKRFPSIDAMEGYDWVLSVFGGAHTTWNFTKSLWAHHWGNPDQGEDTGVWRSAFSLGLEYKKHPSAQDFNTIMRSCHIVHKANMVYILSAVLDSLDGFDPTKANDCNKLIELVCRKYFDADALEAARLSEDHTQYNLRLRLRDFATVMEAQEATRAGDIGRLMAMWKRWAVMAQGLPGLSHYSRHIPRLVLLLEEDLPKGLAHAIKHSLLIPSNERDNHWVAMDEFMEIHICWLKHHYDTTGRGTDIDRLILRISNNITMLRKMMQLIKSEAGHKIIYQNNFNGITPASLALFLQYATQSLAGARPTRAPAQVTNVWHAGIRHFIKLIRADKAAGRSSRFRWGAPDVLSSWVNDDNLPED
ncbi:hypothetical protein DFH28DRAFT_1131935 [Melampsora americana]|nr:hypothetical protein DFH28DRAFT_1131935 [Melampsora americana]